MTSKLPRSKKTLVKDARQALATCPAVKLRTAARQVDRFMDARLHQAGLSAVQFNLLAQIAAAKDDTIGAIARDMGLDASTLSRNLRAFERHGWVEIAVVEKDLRRRAVWLTETGARRLEVAIKAWKKAAAELDNQLNSNAITRLCAVSRGFDVPPSKKASTPPSLTS